MKKYISTTIALFLLSSQAQAVELGYDYTQLNRIWTTLGEPSAATFEDILGSYEINREVTIDPAKGTVSGSKCKPPRQCVAGQTASTTPVSPTAPVKAVEFDVVRVKNPQNLQNIYRRYGMISLYVAKNLNFNGVVLSPDDKARLPLEQHLPESTLRTNAIRQQMASAAVENYLLNMAQYYLAEDLGAKCSAVNRAKSVYKGSLASLNRADLLPAWANLYDRFKTFIDATERNENRFLACKVSSTTARAQVIETINASVNGEIARALSEKVAATVSLLNSADIVSDCSSLDGLSEFQKLACLKRGVDGVSFRLEDTFNLARNVKNIRANLDFVKEAEAGVRARQDAMIPEAGLSELYKPIPGKKPFPQLSEVGNATKEVTTLAQVNEDAKGRVKASLASLVKLADAVKDVPVCKQAQDIFLKLSASSQTEQNEFMSRLESCLSGLTNSLSKKIQPNAEDALQDKFAEHVQALSSSMQAYVQENSKNVIDYISQPEE